MHMDQKIFTVGVSETAITLYLLLTGLADSGESLTQKKASGMWNDTPEAFEAAWQELAGRGIIKPDASDGLRLCPSEMWGV